MNEYAQYKQWKDKTVKKWEQQTFQERLLEIYRGPAKHSRLSLVACKFEKDVYGFYLTPLLGYSSVNGQRSIWIGWLFWLFSINF